MRIRRHFRHDEYYRADFLPSRAAGNGFAKTGIGTVILSNPNNNFTGLFRIFGGTLVVPVNGALGTQTADNFLEATLSGAGAFIPSEMLLQPTSGDLNYSATAGVSLIAGTPFIGMDYWKAPPEPAAPEITSFRARSL